MRSVLFFLILTGWGLFAYTQEAEASLSELMDTYFDKRKSALSSSTKKITAEKQIELNALVDQMKAIDESSFEYNLVVYINGNYNSGLQDALFKAYALNSSHELVLKEMLALYIITSNTAKQKEFLGKVQKFYTTTELNYYADALPDSKSVLVASNQEDMYGFLLAQTVLGAGENVTVVNLDFMKDNDYRKMVSTQTGMTDQAFLGTEKAYLKTMLTSSSQKVVISATVPQDYFSLVADQFFVTGLVYQYGNVDQQTALGNFWAMIKTRDLAKVTLSSKAEKELYANYLPPLITLLLLQPDDQLLKSSIRSMATKIGNLDEVDQILKELGVD